jgi:hypothetical protein
MEGTQSSGERRGPRKRPEQAPAKGPAKDADEPVALFLFTERNDGSWMLARDNESKALMILKNRDEALRVAGVAMEYEGPWRVEFRGGRRRT